MDLYVRFKCYLGVTVLVAAILGLQTASEIASGSATRRPNFDNKNQDIRLLWQRNKRRTSLCVGECVRDEQCASVFYNNITGQCHGHSITFGHPGLAIGAQDFRLYVLKHGEKYIGDYCTVNSDCATANAECRSEMCQCLPEYSFSPRTRECKVCSVYGGEFWGIDDHFVSTQNVETIENMSLKDCCDACVSSTNYTCKSLEYGRSSLKCYLSNITVLDFPERWYHDSGLNFNISYYQRDCQ